MVKKAKNKVKVVHKIKRVRANVKEKSFIDWKSKMRDRFKKDNIFVEMLHYNGSISHFTVGTRVHKFNYKKKTYIIDEERKLWNNSTRMFMFRYHEGFSLPFVIEVTSHDLKKALPDDQRIEQVSTSYNPYVLPDVLKFEYAKGVIQGAAVHDFIKRSFALIIVTLLASVLHLGLNAYMSGWIK